MSLAVVPDRPVWLDIEDAMADAAGFVNLGHAQLVNVMIDALHHRVCSGGGFISPAHWLTVHAGVSNAHANQIVCIAEQAAEFPHVMSLLRAGKLSLDQTAAAMTANPAADRRVAEFAELATVQQIRKFVRTVAARPAPTPSNDRPNDNEPSDTGPGDGAAGEGATGAVETGDEHCGADEVRDDVDGVKHAQASDNAASPTSGDRDGSEGDPTAAAEGQGADPTARRHSRSSGSVSFGFDEWSRFRLHANNLTTDQGMILDAALNEARDYLFRNGHPNVTWADALVEICRRSLTTAGTQRAERFKTYLHINRPKRGSDAGKGPADNPAGNNHTPPATTCCPGYTEVKTSSTSTQYVPGPRNDSNAGGTVPSGTVQSATNTASGTAAITPNRERRDQSGHQAEGEQQHRTRFDAVLTNGMPVPPTIRDNLTCDTLIQIIWQDGHLPIGVGNTTRTPPNRLRRLLDLRDQGCAIPGCTNTLGLQAHHIIPWPAGGPTELHNLVLVCDAHHHQHHAGDITITGNPQIPHGQLGALTVTDQYGRTLRTHPTPRPPHPDDRPPNPSYKHPSGETCNYQYLTWQTPPAA